MGVTAECTIEKTHHITQNIFLHNIWSSFIDTTTNISCKVTNYFVKQFLNDILVFSVHYEFAVY